MNSAAPDVAQTRFILPPDAKVLPVAELSARARGRIGAQAEGQWVVTRQGFRVTTRLIPPPLAGLLGEFRTASRLTDGLLRFAQVQGQDPQVLLDAAFDALATLVEARFLVPEGTPEATAPGPSLAVGQEFAGYEIETAVRSLDDSEVFRARGGDEQTVALKISREGRPEIHTVLAHEAQMLQRLGGRDSPALLAQGRHAGRSFLAMEWCSGVSIGVAAQALRAARNRQRLRGLVSRMLEAYGRLHRQGLLHGDIHPGNCLVRDDGRIVILDFGHARPITGAPSGVDITRAGIPQFHDPQMARALLTGALTPAADPASEQYAIAVLAYLLLTGLHPIDAPAERDELLRRIAERPPLPFSARSVAAWPAVEAVLQRALAPEPGQRFASVGAMARAFASADADTGRQRRASSASRGALEQALALAVEGVRRLEPGPHHDRDRAWFALRAAMALEDAQLLAAADLLAGRAGRGWACRAVSAKLAQARSDVRAEGRAMTEFMAETAGLCGGWPLVQALLAAAHMLDGVSPRCVEAAALASWGARGLRQLFPAGRSGKPGLPRVEPSFALAALALVKTGRVPMPRALAPALQDLAQTKRGSVWLWALAHDLFAEERFRKLALSTPLPGPVLMRSFAQLRRFQLTGELPYLAAARLSAGEAAHAGLPDAALALLAAELLHPEMALLPPFPSIFGLRLRCVPAPR